MGADNFKKGGQFRGSSLTPSSMGVPPHPTYFINMSHLRLQVAEIRDITTSGHY